MRMETCDINVQLWCLARIRPPSMLFAFAFASASVSPHPQKQSLMHGWEEPKQPIGRVIAMNQTCSVITSNGHIPVRSVYVAGAFKVGRFTYELPALCCHGKTSLQHGIPAKRVLLPTRTLLTGLPLINWGYGGGAVKCRGYFSSCRTQFQGRQEEQSAII